MPSVITTWRALSRVPGGRRLFSRVVSRRAPYFGSIRAVVVEAGPGRAVAVLRKRRRVENHLGTVHAIAMANLLELAMGVCAEVSIPPHLRWIPKGMTIEYRAKAGTDITGVAEVTQAWAPGDLDVVVTATDTAGAVVVAGTIRLWISERPGRVVRGR